MFEKFNYQALSSLALILFAIFCLKLFRNIFKYFKMKRLIRRHEENIKSFLSGDKDVIEDMARMGPIVERLLNDADIEEPADITGVTWYAPGRGEKHRYSVYKNIHVMDKKVQGPLKTVMLRAETIYRMRIEECFSVFYWYSAFSGIPARIFRGAGIELGGVWGFIWKRVMDSIAVLSFLLIFPPFKSLQDKIAFFISKFF